jgi:hypothetical protein
MASRASGAAGFTDFGDPLISPLTSRLTTMRSWTFCHIRCPVTASHNMMPTEKRSARRSMAPPTACSGAMYVTFPFTTPVRVSAERPTAFAIPKSTTFT